MSFRDFFILHLHNPAESGRYKEGDQGLLTFLKAKKLPRRSWHILNEQINILTPLGEGNIQSRIIILFR